MSNNLEIPKDQAQRDLAINTLDSNVLVSASAGSGKTFIMTQKVAKMVSGSIESSPTPKPITNMMIVTFTRASAKDLKTKVVEAIIKTIQDLKDKYSQEKDNTKKAEINKTIELLKGQMEDVAIASISTIDSLCSNIVREYSSIADVDPSFTVMEEDEANLSLSKAIKNVLRELNKNPDEDYLKLYKFFGENDLKDALTKAYKFVRNNNKYLDYLENDAKAMYKGNLLDNEIVNRFFKDFYKKLEYYEQLTNDLLKETRKIVTDNYRKTYESYINLAQKAVQNYRKVEIKNLPAVCAAQLDMGSMPSDKKADPSEVETMRYLSNKLKDIKFFFNKPNGMCKKIAAINFEDEEKNNAADVVLVNRFIEIIKQVDAEYSKLKKADNKLDFNDIEQKVAELLDDESGIVKTALQARYDYLFVDECQDVNPLQDYIIGQISNGKNLFMVGDIKQSIYGFRLSDPSLFLGRYKSYLDNSGDGVAVELNTNFRSKQGILDFANDVFRCNMTDDFGGIDYENSAMLNPIDHNAEKDVTRAQIAIFATDKKETNNQLQEDGVYSVEGHNFAESGNKNDKEAQYIANKIHELTDEIDGVPAKYKLNEITLLFKARSKEVENIVSKIRQSGIPIDMSNAIKESKSSEISTLIALLNVIDNDKQDIPLINVLLSVFGGFTPTELATINKATKRVPGKIEFFHQAFDAFENDEIILNKINIFKALLDKYRFDSQFMSVADLLEKIVDETRYDEYVLAQIDGDSALNQIQTFIKNLKGKTYNSSISKFLSTYREYDSIDSTKEVFNISENCVKTATIHASKGLDYKVVFVVDVAHGQRNDTDKLILQKDAGIVFKHFDEETLSYSKSFVYNCATEAKDKETQEEMMRTFYVALTRAKDYMYITGTDSHELPNYGEEIISSDEIKSSQDATDMYFWLRYASANIDYFKSKYSAKDCDDIVVTPNNNNGDKCDVNYKIQDNSFVSEINKLTLDNYDYKESTQSPLWYSVTQLNTQDSDTEFNAPVEVIEEDLEGLFGMDGETSTEAGTAYHRVLELLDFNKTYTKEDIEDEMKQMVLDGKLSQIQYEAVKVQDILSFLNSDLMKSIKGNMCIKEQEFRMYTKLPKEIMGKELADKVLIQGTFDLFVPRSETNKEGILIDYKYSHKKPEEVGETYKKQLCLYKLAIEKCLNEQVDKMYLYVLGQNALIEIKH